MRKSLLATYIKIFIVILIIGALMYGAVQIFNKGYDKQKFETIKTDMLAIQAQTEVIGQKVEIKEKGAKYVGTPIKEKQNEEIIKKLTEEKVIELNSKKSTYYCLDNSNLEELGLNNIKIDDFYIVDYKKNDVIYVDGIENNEGKIVYKLSEMK